MGYNLGSEDPDEVEYYKKIKIEILKDSSFRYLGIQRSD